MGAPGSSYWTGSVFVYNITTNTYKAFLDKNNQVKFGSYLGTIKNTRGGVRKEGGGSYLLMEEN